MTYKFSRFDSKTSKMRRGCWFCQDELFTESLVLFVYLFHTSYLFIQFHMLYIGFMSFLHFS